VLAEGVTRDVIQRACKRVKYLIDNGRNLEDFMLKHEKMALLKRFHCIIVKSSYPWRFSTQLCTLLNVPVEQTFYVLGIPSRDSSRVGVMLMLTELPRAAITLEPSDAYLLVALHAQNFPESSCLNKFDVCGSVHLGNTYV
jgi:hypothetical protein